MKIIAKSLNKSLENKVVTLTQENEFYKTENAALKEQLNWFQRQIFGNKSERTVSGINQDQLTFDGFENLQDLSQEQKTKVPSHARCKPNRNGQDKIVLPPDLPVETIILDIPEDQKTCKETGQSLVKIGEDVSHKLAHKPGSYYIKEIIRPKYALPNEGILMAELPDSIIPRCRADESFLAEILTRKFADHLPLYRISEILQRQDVHISRKLLSQWVVRCALTLKPLRDEMLKQILESKNIFVDKTPVTVLEKKSEVGYLWTICGGSSADPADRIYFFKKNRKEENIIELLKNYHGVLHSDKYGGYVKLAQNKKITWSPCRVHIRRKFFEAESGDAIFRQWVLDKIKMLFEIEEKAWIQSEDIRLEMRKKLAEPIIDELIEKIKDKLINGNILPKSKLRAAMGYFCSLIPYIKNYLHYPFAGLDNNVAEHSIRPIAIGRKNWMFFCSVNGGEAGAVILSLVQTCRSLGINPRDYLEDILRRLMSHSFKKLHKLLPEQ